MTAKPYILLVDVSEGDLIICTQDSEFSLKVIKKMLGLIKCDVETAEHGQNAVKIY